MNYNNASLFFVGDSIARRLFLATKVALGDAQEADFEKMDGVLRDSQDEDISHTTLDGVTIAFRWDPFLNTTSYRDRRVFPVVSAGFWHSQHFGEDPATAFGHFQQSVHALLNHWDRSFSDSDATNPFLLRLVSPVVHAKLSPNRQETFREKNLEEYNRFIRDFSALHSLESHSSSSTSLPLASEALHAVFMNHPDLAPRTEDGFQYDYSVTSTELNVLLNGICNEKLFNGLNSKRKVTACCHSGPKLKSKNYFFMGSLILYAVSCLIWRSLDCSKYMLI